MCAAGYRSAATSMRYRGDDAPLPATSSRQLLEQRQLQPGRRLQPRVQRAPRRPRRRGDDRRARRLQRLRRRLRVVDLERHADVARHAAADLHLVDVGGVGRVGQLQRRPARLQARVAPRALGPLGATGVGLVLAALSPAPAAAHRRRRRAPRRLGGARPGRRRRPGPAGPRQRRPAPRPRRAGDGRCVLVPRRDGRDGLVLAAGRPRRGRRGPRARRRDAVVGLGRRARRRHLRDHDPAADPGDRRRDDDRADRRRPAARLARGRPLGPAAPRAAPAAALRLAGVAALLVGVALLQVR